MPRAGQLRARVLLAPISLTGAAYSSRRFRPSEATGSQRAHEFAEHALTLGHVLEQQSARAPQEALLVQGVAHTSCRITSRFGPAICPRTACSGQCEHVSARASPRSAQRDRPPRRPNPKHCHVCQPSRSRSLVPSSAAPRLPRSVHGPPQQIRSSFSLRTRNRVPGVHVPRTIGDGGPQPAGSRRRTRLVFRRCMPASANTR